MINIDQNACASSLIKAHDRFSKRLGDLTSAYSNAEFTYEKYRGEIDDGFKESCEVENESQI